LNGKGRLQKRIWAGEDWAFETLVLSRRGMEGGKLSIENAVRLSLIYPHENECTAKAPDLAELGSVEL